MASLYLHIPFCEHKCIYCDFYSIAPDGSRTDYESLTDRFVEALKREIVLRAAEEQFHTSYETIFFGGGTPSLLSPTTIGEILNLLHTKFSVQPNAEITLETNPGTVDRHKLLNFRSAGVNRLSFGVQSFHDDDLKFLTRIHSAEQAKECVRAAFEARFENVSLDLIFSLPGQTTDRWKSNLEQAIALQPTHVSSYSLIVEPNTPLKRMVESKQVQMLSLEEDAALYEMTMEFFQAHGYEQYEVSNFAKPGFRSQHNSNYWNHSNYLSFGPSAHSFWNNRRWWNVANLVNYCARIEAGAVAEAGAESLTDDQLRQEKIFLGLRSDGIRLAPFRQRFQYDLVAAHRPTIDQLVRDGLARLDDERLQLTAKGYLICDEICNALS
jgi:oxygen-independent coproporphyrinogen-3 oxidase